MAGETIGLPVQSRLRSESRAQHVHEHVGPEAGPRRRRGTGAAALDPVEREEPRRTDIPGHGERPGPREFAVLDGVDGEFVDGEREDLPGMGAQIDGRPAEADPLPLAEPVSTRSFCYVSDLVEGLSRLIGVDANPECPVNIGNPEEFTLNELARLVLSLTGSQSRTVHEPLPADDPRCRRPDISRARMLLDRRPSVPLAAGLMRTIPWFVEHGAEPAVGASAPALPRRVAVPGLMMGAK